MKVTLREVAKQAGLSLTTVSRALNGHSAVLMTVLRLHLKIRLLRPA